MVLENIFANNLINTVRSVSRDSKIYEAFQTYFELQGITLDDYMNDKELRKIYRQKYTAIKLFFQQQNQSRAPLSDKDCLVRITEQGIEWREFIETARENTLDNGETFLQSLPMDKYVIMTPKEKRIQENRLVEAAIQRIRTFDGRQQIQSKENELQEMLNENKTDVNITERMR